MANRVRILSIDGGGIRGVIPAMICEELERRTGKPACELFDLMAGTSTGGIIALGLTKPDPAAPGKPHLPASALVNLYEAQGARIFSRSVWHRIHAVGSAFEEKYPADGIEGVLEEVFGGARLRDSLVDCVIPSYDIERRDPYFFKTAKARANPAHDFAMREVARATSAAPTYFEPAKLAVGGSPADYMALVDGGVFANNPAMCGYAEARKNHPDADFLVVSLGTGELTRPIPYDDAKDWGLLGWALPLLGVIFDGVSDTVDYELRQVLPDIPERAPRYYRFKIRLDMGNDDMDDASQTNIHALKTLGRRIIEESAEALDTLCAELMK